MTQAKYNRTQMLQLFTTWLDQFELNFHTGG